MSARSRARPHGSAGAPLRRRRVLAGTLLAAAALAGVVGLAEALRHPLPGAAVADPEELAGDPRAPLDCPSPAPPDDSDGDPVPAIRPAEPAVSATSTELLDCPRSFDRQVVRYRGEAVGGVLRRQDGAWVQVNDDVYAEPAGPLPGHRTYRGANTGIGVFLPAELVEEVSVVGGPRSRGDLVEVIGVFRRLDSASREVAVIRAASVEVVRPGTALDDPPLRGRQVAAGLLAMLALLTAAAERVAARRR